MTKKIRCNDEEMLLTHSEIKDGECSKSRQENMGGLYMSIRGLLMNVASRYLKKGYDVEDVVQEAFVKMLEAQKKRHISSPKAYLYQTTKNISLNVVGKSEYRLTDTLGDFLPESVLLKTASLEEQFESTRKFELFCCAVRKLPPKCRRTYIMRRVYGFSQKEISEELGISVKTVEAHLTKAIIHCTDYMKLLENMDASDAKSQSGVASGLAPGQRSSGHNE